MKLPQQAQEATPADIAPPPLSQRNAQPDPKQISVPDRSAWTGHHSVDIRLTIPFLPGRYYLTILSGKERRSAKRRKEERQKHSLATRGNLVFFALVGTVIGLAGLGFIRVATIYLLDQSGALVP